MSVLVDSALEWLAANGPPNWLFLVAVLTSPARWSSTAWSIIDERLSGREDDDE